MRRAVARGRMLPQSLSTDPRYGRLSLKAQVLYPLLWINADDQGRLSGDADEIKYAACPSVREITADDIPSLLQEMEKRNLVKLYATSRTQAVQMLDWWDVQKLQWAYPSDYPAPEGWQDRLRYHASPKEIVTENWPAKSPNSLGKELPSAPPNSLANSLPSELANSLGSTLQSDRESSKEITENKKEGGKRRGRGNLPSALPSALGNKSSPSPSTDQTEILRQLTHCFRIEWGRVLAEAPDKVIPREPGGRETAQLRDLAKELSAVGGVPLNFIKQAFRDAAGRPDKMHISYVRAILLDWLGVARGPPA